MSSRSAYSGTRRKLVLAFDVGTTYSGISYSILDPGQCPSIYPVNRFPGQEIISGASKVPSIIFYDREGRVKAIGAEALSDGIRENAIEGGWYKTEWFKLHLRSKYTGDMNFGHNVPSLPPNKSVVDVFADYLRYLLDCAASYIKDSHSNGRNLWISSRDDIHFVISHPNGWEGKEQSQMRKAAVKARLVPDDPSGHSRISFVTEGEASLHFAIENCVLPQTMKGIIIVDAGGGTIDVSTYAHVASTDANERFEEISVAQCYFNGSVFVTFRAKDFMKVLLVGSSFADDVDHICDCFDKTTKTRFRNASEPQYTKFGSTRENDPTLGIRFGQLKLSGFDIAKFFQPSVDCIVQAVLEQKKTARKEISHVIMVGGFAGSDYLFKQIELQLMKTELVLLRPDNRLNKAVSDGAISFFLDHHVRTRVAKGTYGMDISLPYDKLDPEHVRRSASRLVSLDGLPYTPGAFRVVLPKNMEVSETKEFTGHFKSLRTSMSDRIVSVISYRGSQNNPKWIDSDPANFTTVCKVIVNVSQIPKITCVNPAGGLYYSMPYDLVLIFGLTEFQVQIQWFENGVRYRSPAQLIYDGL